MRLSLTDNTFRLLEPWERVLDLARLLGLEAVDVCVMGNRSHLRPEAVRQDLHGVAERIAYGIAARSLAISDLFCIPWTDFERLAPNHPDPAERAESRALFDDLLELAVRVGSPGMTMLPGIDWPGETHETSFDRAVEELAARAAAARERGVRFSVEAHLGSIAQEPGEAARLCAEAPGVELTLDYSHFVYQGLDDEQIEPLVPLARHVHVRGAAARRMQAPLAESTIDFERMVGALARAGYDGDLSLEYLWIAWEGLNECDTVSETILLRDRLLAALEGREWRYPVLGI
jgi:sugar phosphate isomerase/epimerase